MSKNSPEGIEAFEKCPAGIQGFDEITIGDYFLRLYSAGITRKSSTAIGPISEICDEYLKGRCALEIIDTGNQPTQAKGEQIIAAPTLIKRSPPPLRKLVGDTANKERVLVGLDLRHRNEQEQDETRQKKG